VKSGFRIRHYLPPLFAFGLVLAGQVSAQTFTVLHSFSASSTNSLGAYTNNDGAQPSAGVNLSGNTLYGTTGGGGSSGKGTVFAANTNGTGFANVYTFNTNGWAPNGLLLANNTLYGTTAQAAGSSGVFKVNADGTGFTTLHRFSSNFLDGTLPAAGLVLSGSTLYGTTSAGSTWGNGNVFSINTNGSGFTTLYVFSQTGFNDGYSPDTTLLLSGSTLYGTASRGGNYGSGTVFKLNTDGTGFTTLHSFTALNSSSVNSDGAHPAGLFLSGSTLYGTARYGGSAGYGTVFALQTDGTGFVTLHSFTGGSDGESPDAPVILWGNVMYGTTAGGNGITTSNGTVFALKTDGTGFTTLHSFTASYGPYPSTNIDGAVPYAGLLLSGNTLYGTASRGGNSGNGTVFSITLPSPPQLAIIHSRGNIIFSWPANATGFTLQSATNLSSPVWTTNLPPPVIANGQYTVTNPISGTQEFFRLSQ